MTRGVATERLDRPTFDREWGDHSGGPVPAWLTVDPGLLSTAREWVRTETYAAERDHLDAHPELLEPSADVAVEEALLAVSEAAAGRYTALRQAARQEGTETAYRPLLLAILAQEFATSDPGQQRAMLATRRDDLLSDAVAAHLHDLAAQDDDLSVAALQARALLDLARQDDAEMVFEAVARPEEFPGLLHALAVRPDPSSLIPAAIVASSLAVGQAQAAAALFYCGHRHRVQRRSRPRRRHDRAGPHARRGSSRGMDQRTCRASASNTTKSWRSFPSSHAHPGPARRRNRPMTATDLAVVLPGILGSTLAQDGHLVWAPSAGSALRAIGTFGASITRLELPAGIGDDHPHDRVEPVALMPDLHVLPGIWTPVKGYDMLLARLRSLGYREPDGPGAPPGNLLPVPYDWRLSCRYNGRGSARSSSPPCSDGGTRAGRTPTHRSCSSATPWAG